MNGAGLLLVWFLVGSSQSARDWLITALVTVLVMDLGFWFLNPDLYWYVGMSGLLHGMLAAGIVLRIGSLDGETLVLLVLLVAKIAWEQWSGPMPGSASTSGGAVIVDAHLYGAAGGAFAVFVLRIRSRSSATI